MVFISSVKWTTYTKLHNYLPFVLSSRYIVNWLPTKMRINIGFQKYKSHLCGKESHIHIALANTDAKEPKELLIKVQWFSQRIEYLPFNSVFNFDHIASHEVWWAASVKVSGAIAVCFDRTLWTEEFAVQYFSRCCWLLDESGKPSIDSLSHWPGRR